MHNTHWHVMSTSIYIFSLINRSQYNNSPTHSPVILISTDALTYIRAWYVYTFRVDATVCPCCIIALIHACGYTQKVKYKNLYASYSASNAEHDNDYGGGDGTDSDDNDALQLPSMTS